MAVRNRKNGPAAAAVVTAEKTVSTWDEEYKQLQQALEAADIGVWNWDLNTNQVIMSIKMKEILDLGKGAKNHTFDTFIKAIHPEDGPRVVDVMKKAIKRKVQFDEEFRTKKKDGKIHWMRIRGRVLSGADGRPQYVMGSIHDKTERRMAFDTLSSARDELEEKVKERTLELMDANEQLRREITIKNRLEEQIMEISEKEQRRIGQDLHDSLSQQLGGILFMGQVLLNKLNRTAPAEARDLGKLIGHLKNALTYTKDLAKGLYPTLGEGGLRTALNELAVGISELYGVTVTVECPGNMNTFDETATIHIYRIVQEALNNAIKHGQAGRIAIRIFKKNGTAMLTVADNGTGFPEKPNRKGMGLNIMEYRASSIGASLKIETKRDRGTVVKCAFGKPRALAD